MGHRFGQPLQLVSSVISTKTVIECDMRRRITACIARIAITGHMAGIATDRCILLALNGHPSRSQAFDLFAKN
jgi:hypothetical protein